MLRLRLNVGEEGKESLGARFAQCGERRRAGGGKKGRGRDEEKGREKERGDRRFRVG